MRRFSILLPVHNGGDYLKVCIESILNQTYPHFILHILENASTDNMMSWIKKINDPRIQILETTKKLSIEDNWKRIKDIQKEEFMTFLGHDDLYDNNYLEIINSLIERDPKASLYETGSRLINGRGDKIRSCQPVSSYETASKYLFARLTSKRDSLGTGFVMRSKDYGRLGGIPTFERLLFADDALWLSLTKISWKAADQREAFSVRIHSESMSAFPAWPYTIIALDQFVNFLNIFTKKDKASHKIYRRYAPKFLLQYHRNIYIFALLEASKKGVRINTDIFHRLRISLKEKAPEMVNSFTDSIIIKILEILNRSLLRNQIAHVWKLFYLFKTKSI